MVKKRRAAIKTIKNKDGTVLYMATLGGQGYYYPTKSKQQAKEQVEELRIAETSNVKRQRNSIDLGPFNVD